MSTRAVLAGVGNLELYDAQGDMIAFSKTLVTSGIDFSLSSEEVRGGLANQLLAKYFHDSAMTFTLEDAIFDLNYIALNVGSAISTGADVMTVEEVTTTVANEITVTGTPQPFLSTGLLLGWYKLPAEENWTKIEFTDQTATVTGLDAGTTVCVKYVANNEACDFFTVSSAYIPSQCTAILYLPLFKSGATAQSYSTSSKIGEVQVEIPNFLLDGAMSLSLSSSGVATTSLSGSALATFTGNEGCDGDGYYAKLKQIIYNKGEFDDVQTIVVEDSMIDVEVDGTQTLKVYAIYGGNTVPKLISNSKLTFTSTDDTVAEVSTAGVVTGKAAGNATIQIKVTTKPALEATAYVEVTAP